MPDGPRFIEKGAEGFLDYAPGRTNPSTDHNDFVLLYADDAAVLQTMTIQSLLDIECLLAMFSSRKLLSQLDAKLRSGSCGRALSIASRGKWHPSLNGGICRRASYLQHTVLELRS